MSAELKVGDRIQVVLEVVRAGDGQTQVSLEGMSDKHGVWFYSDDLLAHGTLLPPKPKPLQVGDRVRAFDGRDVYTIAALDGDEAWLIYADNSHATYHLSDLTRVDGDG